MGAGIRRIDAGFLNSDVAAAGRSEAWQRHATLQATHALTQPWLSGQQQQVLPVGSIAKQ